jgi:peptidoglycan-N-acetylglucosamine deacetylase
MHFILTVDVERLSFETNSYHDSVAKKVEKEGLPKLLDLFDKYNIVATFYSTARYCQLAKHSLSEIIKKGHEVGCHGFDHSDYYDSMDYQSQFQLLSKSKKIIEDIIGREIISFRAPALRINKHTVRALENAGFQTDSSIASQRFDGPFTSGALKKLAWLTAGRKPYNMDYDNPFKKGRSSIIEIPVTAFVWPFIGTHMRLSPNINSIFQSMFMAESKITKKPLVFLIHPNECIDFTRKETTKRGSWFSDYFRHKLKMKNLGTNAVHLLENVIIKARKRGADFTNIKQYITQL